MSKSTTGPVHDTLWGLQKEAGRWGGWSVKFQTADGMIFWPLVGTGHEWPTIFSRGFYGVKSCFSQEVFDILGRFSYRSPSLLCPYVNLFSQLPRCPERVTAGVDPEQVPGVWSRGGSPSHPSVAALGCIGSGSRWTDTTGECDVNGYI